MLLQVALREFLGQVQQAGCFPFRQRCRISIIARFSLLISKYFITLRTITPRKSISNLDGGPRGLSSIMKTLPIRTFSRVISGVPA
jgi:hypothetical protein